VAPLFTEPVAGGDLPAREGDRVGPEAEAHGGAPALRRLRPRLQASDPGVEGFYIGKYPHCPHLMRCGGKNTKSGKCKGLKCVGKSKKDEERIENET
jgi:hypothetical protein